MKRLFMCVALAFAATSAACAASAEKPREWLRLVHVGYQNHIVPTVWITAQRDLTPTVADIIPDDVSGLTDYKQMVVDGYVEVVSPEDYVSLSKLVHAPSCEGVTATTRIYGTTEIAESAGGRKQVLCVLEQADACALLNKMGAVASDAAPTPDRMPLHSFTDYICLGGNETALTVPH